MKKWFEQTSSFLGELDVPLIRRKKTCPSCRTVLTSRPVEMYTLKSITELLVTTSSDQKKASTSMYIGFNDIWENIFHPDVRAKLSEEGALIDHEDGGVARCPGCLHEIWDGLCTGCGDTFGDQDAVPAISAVDEGSDSVGGSEEPASRSDEYEGSFIDDDGEALDVGGSARGSFEADESINVEFDDLQETHDELVIEDDDDDRCEPPFLSKRMQKQSEADDMYSDEDERRNVIDVSSDKDERIGVVDVHLEEGERSSSDTDRDEDLDHESGGEIDDSPPLSTQTKRARRMQRIIESSDEDESNSQ